MCEVPGKELKNCFFQHIGVRFQKPAKAAHFGIYTKWAHERCYHEKFYFDKCLHLTGQKIMNSPFKECWLMAKQRCLQKYSWLYGSCYNMHLFKQNKELWNNLVWWKDEFFEYIRYFFKEEVGFGINGHSRLCKLTTAPYGERNDRRTYLELELVLDDWGFEG